MPAHQIVDSKLTAGVINEAGRCVACGLCLPYCPTYKKTLDEADSPRGRIMMMGAVLSGELAGDKAVLRHLDACLACRACEKKCPNKVAYGALIDDVRALMVKRRRSHKFSVRLTNGFLKWCIVKPARVDVLGRALRFAQRFRLQQVFRSAGLSRLLGLSRLERVLPTLGSPVGMQECYPAEGGEKGTVALFLGCVARVIDLRTLKASIFLLNRMGYTVRIPSGQVCCGALHASQGERDVFALLARKNVSVFNSFGGMEVVVAAAGCAAAMREYPRTQGDEGLIFGKRIRDITEFLVSHGDGLGLEVDPLYERIAVHEPCSQGGLGSDAVYQLLCRIPGTVLVALTGNDQCCGAAGVYQFTQPDMADMLASDKVNAIRESGARIVVTTNFGCGRHMAAAARDAGLDLDVMHPVELLARRMGFVG
ncbi:MAG: (Fe-S)-binding protein [Sulfuricella sp.]|nr:(Fe-S)-binding protein [Sulfuricella sp.]